MSRSNEERERERVWKSLSEAGLVEIALEQFPERIKQAKNVVMGRLSELLELAADIQERRAVAHSLGALQKLERTVRVDAAQSRSNNPTDPRK